jgi:hypothetical protein
MSTGMNSCVILLSILGALCAVDEEIRDSVRVLLWTLGKKAFQHGTLLLIQLYPQVY